MENIKARVVRCYEFIRDNLADLDRVVGTLYSKEVLSNYDKNFVEKGSENKTDRACFERLFQCLLGKEKDAVWETFYQSLQACEEDSIVKRLQETPCDNINVPCTIVDIQASFLKQPQTVVQVHQHFYQSTEDPAGGISNLPPTGILGGLGSSASISNTEQSYVQVMENNVRLLLNAVDQWEGDGDDLQVMVSEIEEHGSLILVGPDKDQRSRLGKLLLRNFSKQNYTYKPLILQRTKDWEQVQSKMKEHVILLEDILGNETMNKIEATAWADILPSLPIKLLKSKCPLLISFSTSVFAQVKQGNLWQLFESFPVHQITRRKRRSTKKETPSHRDGKFVRSLSQPLEVMPSELHVACFTGDVSQVKQLMHEEGAKVGLNNAGQTPLQVACSQQHVNIVSLLLDVEDNDLFQYTEKGLMNVDCMLLKSATLGHHKVVEQLLNQGADPKTADEAGRMALHQASLHNHAEVLSVLLERESNTDTKDKDGCTPLHHACLAGHEQSVKILLKAGAATDLPSSNGFTVLHAASSQNRTAIISLLLEAKVDVDQVTKVTRETSLHISSSSGHTDVVDVLVASKAALEARDDKGATALHAASQHGMLAAVGLLLSKGADANASNKNGKTPLHKASKKNHFAVVQCLLQNGAEIDEPDQNGQSPLHHACKYGSVAAVAILSKHGANNTMFDKDLNTPVHVACEAGHPSSLNAMVRQVTTTPTDDGVSIIEVTSNITVDWLVPNTKLDTPLHCACRSGQILSVWFLIGNGAFNDRPNLLGNSPLHEACQQGNAIIVRSLLDMKAKTDALNRQGYTPLHIASINGQSQIVRMLIDSGANLEVKDPSGSSPLHLASEKGHLTIVKMLLDKNCEVNAGGLTPLHLASIQGDPDVVKTLIDHGANPNANSKVGQSALFFSSYFGHKSVVDILLQCKTRTLLPEDGFQSLAQACQFGHIDIVQNLLDHGANVTTGVTAFPAPLQLAVLHGHVQVAKLLIDRCPPSCLFNGNEGRQNVLHLACWKGQRSIVSLLLEKELMDVNCTDVNGSTPLQHASQMGQADIVEMLLKAGAEVNSANKNGHTALHFASSQGHEKAVQLLVIGGADVHLVDNNGLTALHLASVKGHHTVVEHLIKAKSDVNKKSLNCQTPLHLATRTGLELLVKMLIRAGAKMDIADNMIMLPLHVATASGFANIVQTFLDAGSPVNNTDMYGITALHWACAISRPDIVQMLLCHGAKANISNELKETPLSVASLFQSAEIVKILLNHLEDADVLAVIGACTVGNLEIVRMLFDRNVQYKQFLSGRFGLLHQAFKSGNLELVRYLLDKGADANDEDENGQTPLYNASAVGSSEIVLLLLNCHAEQVADKNEITPLHMASFQGSVLCVEALLQHGASVKAKDTLGYIPLHPACKEGHRDVAELLVEKGSSIEEKDKSGNTPLMFACEGGFAELVKFLLGKGARADAKNSAGQTALDFACRGGHIACVKLLLEADCYHNCTLVFLVPNITLLSSSRHTSSPSK